VSGRCVVCLGAVRDRYLHAHAKCLYEAIYFMRDGFAGAPVSAEVMPTGLGTWFWV